MLLNSITSLSLPTVLLLFAASFCLYTLLWALYTFTLHPLAHIPGPRFAALTNWWYFLSARLRFSQNTNSALHRRYASKTVRIRPNAVSVSDPRAIDVVFGTRPKWQRTEFFEGFNPHIEGANEVFSLRDENLHVEIRRRVGHLWTVAAMTEYEPRVDRIVGLLRARMDEAAVGGQTVKMERLASQYALDVLGETFYGKEGGFGGVQGDVDYRGWSAMLTNMIGPLSVMGYLPKGFQTLYFLSQMLISKGARQGIQAHSTVVEQAQTIVQQRMNEYKSLGAAQENSMVTKMIGLMRSEKDSGYIVTEGDVTAFVYDAIMAGFDTTAINLSHLWHNILTHPRVYKKLQEEIDGALRNGTLTRNVRYLDCVKLPYLNACVKESMRYTPGGALGLPRYVPPEGVTLPDGTYLPGGCSVTLNWDCVHWDQDTFGEDVDVFRPERWTECDPEQAKRMERSDMSFGGGSRVCLGKHLASMELWKVVPAILGQFDLELVGAPTVTYEWFKRITGLDVKVTRRKLAL